MGTILYGSEITKDICTSLKEQIGELCEKGKGISRPVVILVGDNPVSLSHVTGKEKACREIGMKSILLRLQEDTTEEAPLTEIHRLNTDTPVDGILVQLPLPEHMDKRKVPLTIDPLKGVDSFHPYNIGELILQENAYLPYTPKGVLRMLDTVGYSDLSGPRAVVIGRSNIVGKPVAQLLLDRNATITICHSRTKSIEEICAEANILIASVGNPRLVTADWVRKGAVIIGVGINRVDGRLYGDVDFETVEGKATVITPVPKDAGPMAIAMLLESTLKSYREYS